jgi:hypothetical protein
MLQFRIVIAAILICAFGTASYAQSGLTPVHKSHKTHSKKVPKADDSSVEDWNLAVPGTSSSSSRKTDLGGNESEGRKKFFEQSTTMDNGGPGGSSGGSYSRSNNGGFMPSMGMSF